MNKQTNKQQTNNKPITMMEPQKVSKYFHIFHNMFVVFVINPLSRTGTFFLFMPISTTLSCALAHALAAYNKHFIDSFSYLSYTKSSQQQQKQRKKWEEILTMNHIYI